MGGPRWQCTINSAQVLPHHGINVSKNIHWYRAMIGNGPKWVLRRSSLCAFLSLSVQMGMQLHTGSDEIGHDEVMAELVKQPMREKRWNMEATSRVWLPPSPKPSSRPLYKTRHTSLTTGLNYFSLVNWGIGWRQLAQNAGNAEPLQLKRFSSPRHRQPTSAHSVSSCLAKPIRYEFGFF